MEIVLLTIECMGVSSMTFGGSVLTVDWITELMVGTIITAGDSVLTNLLTVELMGSSVLSV